MALATTRKLSNLVRAFMLALACISLLHAREILQAEFDPDTEKTESDLKSIRLYKEKYRKNCATSPQEIYKIVQSSKHYQNMHPVLKSWIDRNKDHFFQTAEYDDGGGACILYRDKTEGIEINMSYSTKESAIYFNRHYFKNPEDAAWKYVQTPAINPKTKKPWILLNSNEMQQIYDLTKKSFSQEDRIYLDDLLSIVNETLHYYYGEELFSGKNKPATPERYMGKYFPPKWLVHRGFEYFLPEESAQKRALSAKLGRVVYDISKLYNTDIKSSPSLNCGDHATTWIQLKTGEEHSLQYENRVGMQDIDGTNQNYFRQACIAGYLGEFNQNLYDLIQARGVDLLNPEANDTPLKLALYTIYRKTMHYTSKIIASDYVANSAGGNDTGGFRTLAEAVPIAEPAAGCLFGQPDQGQPSLALQREGKRGWSGQCAGTVLCTALSPDNKYAALGCGDNTIHVMDMQTGRGIASWQSAGSITSVAFAPGSSILAFGSSEGLIRVCDFKAKKGLAMFSISSTVTHLAFSSDGSLLAAAGESDANVYNWQTKECMPIPTEFRKIAIGRPYALCNGLAFTEDGSRIVCVRERRFADFYVPKCGVVVREISPSLLSRPAAVHQKDSHAVDETFSSGRAAFLSPNGRFAVFCGYGKDDQARMRDGEKFPADCFTLTDLETGAVAQIP